MDDLATPNTIRRILENHGLHPNKALGQNFIADKNHLSKIVDAALLTLEDGVLEIGPGIGALTVKVAERCRRVVSVEVDRGLVGVLRETCAQHENVTIVHADALKADLSSIIKELATESHRAKVVANLPYYITTPLIFRLLEDRALLQSMVFLVQKEVAARLAAPPGDEKYGALTVAIGYSCDVAQIGTVPGTAFFPRPDVTSSIIRLDVLTEPRVDVPETAFFSVVKAAFGQRRKNLMNALSTLAPKDAVAGALDKAGVDWRRRGETLDISEFAAIARSMVSLQT